jgi:hypothetical protein
LRGRFSLNVVALPGDAAVAAMQADPAVDHLVDARRNQPPRGVRHPAFLALDDNLFLENVLFFQHLVAIRHASPLHSLGAIPAREEDQRKRPEKVHRIRL